MTLKFTTIEEEMKKNPEMKESDLQMLREWCQKQRHLPPIKDVYLALFLHCNYYRMEPTKTTIENFYTCRTHVPELFGNRDPLGSKEFRSALKVIANIPLETKTKEGYIAMYGRLLDTEPSHYDFYECTKIFFMIADLWVVSHGTSNGIVYVANVQGCSMGHVARLNIMALKKLLFYIQEAAPVRLKSIHFINMNHVFEMIVNMVKPFMKKELMEILHFHSSMKTLEEFIDLDALPNEEGGKAGPVLELNEKWLKRMEDHRQWYIEEEASGKVNESLRVGKPKTASDLFGVEGSFRKLDID